MDDLRFKDLFEQEAIGICVSNLQGKFLKVNSKVHERLKYEPDELLGMKFYQITHPDDIEKDVANVNLILDGVIKSFTMPKRYLTKDLEIVEVTIAVTLIKSATGFPRYFLAYIFF